MTDTPPSTDFREEAERALHALRTDEQTNFHYSEDPLSWHALLDAAFHVVMAAGDSDDPVVGRLRHTVEMLVEGINEYVGDDIDEDEDDV